MAIRNFKNKGTEDINYGRASKEANPSQGVASESPDNNSPVWELSYRCKIYKKYVGIGLKNRLVIERANTVFG
jgi:hypothetical protein